MYPDIGHWQRDVFCECTRPVYAHSTRMRAEMPPACKAVAAMPANNVPLAADRLAWEEIRDIGSHAHDLTHELMPDRHRHVDSFLRPIIPVIDVDIGAADRRLFNPNEHIVNADLRLRHVIQPQ